MPTIQQTIDSYGRKHYQLQLDQPSSPSPSTSHTTVRTFLKSRQQKLLLEKMAGKKFDLAKNELAKDRAGFFCTLCKQAFRDSSKFTEHLNSQLHNDKMGMSLQVKKVSVQQIREKLKRTRVQHDEEKYRPNYKLKRRQ